MMLLEYEAKQILSASAIPIPGSTLVDMASKQTLPCVIKSQVPVGGRGKHGGIRVVHTEKEYTQAVEDILNLEIKGFLPQTLLAEEVLTIEKEYYLSLLIDRSSATIMFIASRTGGVEVEDNSDESFLKLPASLQPNFDSIGQAVADWFDLPNQAFAITDMCEKLFRCFKEHDATLIEINPLVLTDQNKLIAADCKMTLDDSARFRHPEWSTLSQQPQDTNYVVLDPKGTVATIANGAGLAMATVDAVSAAGLTPANFLDIGGGANEASVLAAFEKIASSPSVKAIVINIFAGITRCDEVAKAIISATQHIPQLPPLFIRLSGTNSDEANALLDKASIAYAVSLEACIASAKEAV